MGGEGYDMAISTTESDRTLEAIEHVGSVFSYDVDHDAGTGNGEADDLSEW
jgi:hypothetical protein